MSTYQFDQATHTTLLGTSKSGSTLYTGYASNDWTIGTVPNGGYVLSNIFDAVLNHYSQRYQTDPIALNSFFFGKTLPGPFIVELQELKSSAKGYCICQGVLKQHKNIKHQLPTTVEDYSQSGIDADMVVKVHGVFTMGRMDSETGKTYYHNNPKAPSRDKMIPVTYPFMTDLVEGYVDPSTLPHSSTGEPIFHRAVIPGVVPGTPELNQSMAFKDGRPIDAKSLAFYVDMFVPPPALLGVDYWGGPIWCATMQLEILFKRIPKDSPSLLAHFKIPHIINNRFDLDGELFDPQGNVLAVTRHQCLVLDWSRSMVPKM